MSAALLRKIVLILSFVAVAAFAGHGTAMAGMDRSMTVPHTAVQGHGVEHADGHGRSDGHHGAREDAAAGHETMSCCGKSCTSILPLPPAPDVMAEALPVPDPSVGEVDLDGVEPSGPRRPPRLA